MCVGLLSIHEAALLDHLERVGFSGAPRYLGSDERGREVLSYIPGEAPIVPYPAWAFTTRRSSASPSFSVATTMPSRASTPLRDQRDAPAGPDRSLARLALFADAYGASNEQRAGLVEAIVECHRWCYEVVADAVAQGHPVFAPHWLDGGQALAERTHHRLLDSLPELRIALGLC